METGLAVKEFSFQGEAIYLEECSFRQYACLGNPALYDAAHDWVIVREILFF